jgi:putative flippase GtrA
MTTVRDSLPDSANRPPEGMHLALRYTAFAVIATVINIGAQDLVMRLYGGSWALYVSMAVGTLAGLVVKYLLDKRWIFGYCTRGLAHEGWKFFVYSCMGVVTTAIFWGTELAFEFTFETRLMRYLGGIIGLTIGYVAKYWLDKRFVFRG